MLIGFMGAGKSTVGRHLAQLTSLPRFETDEMVAAQAGLSIAEIFAQRGEEEFRRSETEALASFREEKAILVTGGGILTRAENAERLRQLGQMIHLTADEETLFDRAAREGMRPLLQTGDPRATFAELLRTRAPLYRAAADFTIDTTRLRAEEVAQAIVNWTATHA